VVSGPEGDWRYPLRKQSALDAADHQSLGELRRSIRASLNSERKAPARKA
jgi:hypothetical protein